MSNKCLQWKIYRIYSKYKRCLYSKKTRRVLGKIISIFLVVIGFRIGYLSNYTPIRIIEKYYNAIYSEDLTLFMSLFSEEELNQFAAKRQLDEGEVYRRAQESMQALKAQIDAADAQRDEFKLSLTEGYWGKSFTYVKVSYTGSATNIPTFVYIPLEKMKNGKWVLPLEQATYSHEDNKTQEKEDAFEVIKKDARDTEDTTLQSENTTNIYTSNEAHINYYKDAPLLTAESATQILDAYLNGEKKIMTVQAICKVVLFMSISIFI